MNRAPPGLTVVAPALLEGARVRLRPWTEADHAPFAALNADPQVMTHFPAPLTRGQSNAMAERISSLIAERGWGFWAAEWQPAGSGTPAFIGFVGLNSPAAELPFNPCVEIGWRLARPFWGQGLASEAARLALRVGFEVLGLEEIVSFTAVGNLRSRMVMQRLGLQESPGEQFEHPSVPPGHRVRLHCLYRLTRARWAATRRQESGATPHA